MFILTRDTDLVIRAVKLPWLFLGTPLIFIGAPRNIQGNLSVPGYHYTRRCFSMIAHNFFNWSNSINKNGSWDLTLPVYVVSWISFVYNVWQLYDCPHANEATLTNIGKFDQYEIALTHDRSQTMYLILGMCCDNWVDNLSCVYDFTANQTFY